MDQSVNLLDRSHKLRQRAMHPVHLLNGWRLSACSQAIDAFAIVAVCLLVNHLQPQNFIANAGHEAYTTAAGIFTGFCSVFFRCAGLYRPGTLLDKGIGLRAMIFAWLTILATGLALASIAHPAVSTSRLWFISLAIYGLLALTATRLWCGWAARIWASAGCCTRSVAILGSSGLAERLIEQLQSKKTGIRIFGYYSDRQLDEHSGSIMDVPYKGGAPDLAMDAALGDVDTVLITLPIAAPDRLQAAISALRLLPLEIRLLPEEIALRFANKSNSGKTEWAGLQFLILATPPIPEFKFILKSLNDRILAILLLVALSPLFVAVGIAIKLSNPGPILFRQRRIGYKNRPFDIFKFRTMHVPTHQHTELARRNDPRVFKLGHFLRKTSIDELPQLLNVLRGDMSLVGPRPHMPEARAAGLLYFDAVREYACRHRVKPGLTGWAQVNGWRGPTETVEAIERRVEHDIYYIDNWSFFLDLTILMRTVMVPFFGKNAF